MGSDWHGVKNAVTLFSINKIYILYIFFEFSIGPVDFWSLTLEFTVDNVEDYLLQGKEVELELNATVQ